MVATEAKAVIQYTALLLELARQPRLEDITAKPSGGTLIDRPGVAHSDNTGVLKSGAVVFVALSVVNVLNITFHFFVSRRLGVVGYGSFNALISAVTVCATPAVILTTVVVKYAAEFRSIEDAPHLRALLEWCAKLLGALTLTVLLLGALVAPSVATYLRIGDTFPVVLTAGILALTLFLPVRGLLQGIESFVAFAISMVSEAAIKVALALALTALGFGLNGALGAWIVGLVLSALYTYGILFQRFWGVKPAPLNIDYRRLLKTTGNVTLATLLVSSLGYSDVLIVKHFFDPQSAGLYSAAALAGRMIFLVVNFLPVIVLPKAAIFAKEGRRALPILVQALGALSLLVGFGLALYFFFPTLIVTTLAGRAFTAASPLVFPYGVAAALLAVLNTVVYYRMGMHQFFFVIPLTIVALAQLALMFTFHTSALQVIYIVMGCDAAALLSVLLGSTRAKVAPATA
jgi:O-antigen/teichoic acid export membrane protein